MLSSVTRRTTVLCCGRKTAAAFFSQPTCAALRSRPVLLNQLRTQLSREDEMRHQQFEQANAARGVQTPPKPPQAGAAGAPEAGGCATGRREEEEERHYEGRGEYDEFPEDRPSRFKVFTRFLRIFLAGLGWVLFFSSIHNTKEIFAFLEFLDVAFPKKLLAPRVCFDLMPPDEKMRLVGEFRRKQAHGYGESLFDYVIDYHPEVMQATGLTAFETLRRLNYVNKLVYESHEESRELWSDMMRRESRRHSSTQAERLTRLLNNAGAALVDGHGHPLYPGQNIFGAMYDEQKHGVQTFPASETAPVAEETQQPKPGWMGLLSR